MGVPRMAFGSDPVRSLRWVGDTLVDDVRGLATLSLDGEVTSGRVNWAFDFDRAVASPSGRFVVLYVERGTKAVLTSGTQLLAELDRSFYHASAFEYPVCLFALPDGREVIAHCPDAYNRLEIDDLETGERLTERAGGRARDVFHSRLRASPDGRRLLSAGWRWHPYGILDVFDVEEALRRPESLDDRRPSPAVVDDVNAEVESACWLDDDLIVVSTTSEEPLDDEPGSGIGPDEIGVWSVGENRWRSRSPAQARAGTLLPFDGAVLGLFGHPKLLDPSTGAVLAEWPEISTGRQDSSIVWGSPPVPPVATDPVRARFAVADGNDVLVVEVDAPGVG